jgi:hypothetical protein
VGGLEIEEDGTIEEEESDLKHDGQAFHNNLEMPGDHPAHLALPVPTAIDYRPAHLYSGITLEPLFS